MKEIRATVTAIECSDQSPTVGLNLRLPEGSEIKPGDVVIAASPQHAPCSYSEARKENT